MAQEPTPSQSTKKPFPAWVVVLVIAAAAVAAVVLAIAQDSGGNTTNTATANSGDTVDRTPVTYRDPEGRYSFSVPASWVVTKLPDEKAGFQLTPPAGSVTRVFVNAARNPDNLSIEDLFSTFDDTSRLWFSEYEHRAELINGRTAVRFSPFQESAGQPTRVEVAIKGDSLVGLLSYQYQVDQSSAVFNQVVDTFSFL